MKVTTRLIGCGAAALGLMLLAGSAVAQGCGGLTACVVIKFDPQPGSGKGPKPNVDKPKLEVRQDIRKHVGKVTFKLAGPPKAAIVRFHCKGSDCPDPAMPFIDASDTLVEYFIVENGSGRTMKIADDLPECDNSGCGLDDRACIEQHCTYSYSVWDLDGEYEALDPDVIIDPK